MPARRRSSSSDKGELTPEEVQAWLARRLDGERSAVDQEKLEASALVLRSAVDRLSADVQIQIGRLRTAIDDMLESAGIGAEEAPSVATDKIPKDLPIGRGMVISFSMSRTLTDYFQRVIPPSLVEVFANRISRRQGPGWTDTYTLNGATQIREMLGTLYAHRSTSGWYTLTQNVITEIETSVRKRAQTPVKK